MTVEVPFDEILEGAKPTPENLWQNKAQTTRDNIKIPLGPQNVEDNQFLTFGESGTAHHAIIIGRTGSGKTNLMDVIITAAALKYSPDEIEFYLIDLKGGLGFKHYVDSNLPHARVIAIESEREYALSVLRGLITEIEVRTKRFNEETAENIKKYRAAKPAEKVPRILLVIDEFQNLFLEDDQISRESSSILERLTREGRAYGIHVILGSQSLAGKASNLSGATLGQIGVRIALMCSETDARAIMADDNPEARLLSRPGEAIFNDRNGLIEGNKRFQVARFKDEVREKYLGMIAQKAGAENLRKPTVFEGNKLARLEDSEPLKKLILGEWEKDSKRTEAWLGEPIKLSEKPVAVRFRRQAGNNLLVVAKEENEGVGMLAAAWLSLALQHAPATADFYIFNQTNSEEAWFELLGEIGEMLPHRVEKLNRHNLVEKLQQLNDEIAVRVDDSRGDGKTKYLLVFGLQRAKDLRVEDGGGGRFGFSSKEKEPEASELFAKILREGAEQGIHVLTWCDLANNVKRTLDRKSINEFNSRVAAMMSQDDSQLILDNAAASRLDRPHRAIFYDEDRPGYLEKFRPFAIPTDRNWWLKMTENLNVLHSKAQSS
jgi:DNA segregation ATPase FtsK/SpoIIIE-like protein